MHFLSLSSGQKVKKRFYLPYKIDESIFFSINDSYRFCFNMNNKKKMLRKTKSSH